MEFIEVSPNLSKNKELLDFKAKGYRGVRKCLMDLSPNDITKLKDEINYFYFEKEWGLKLVARNLLGVTYTVCRSIFSHLQIDFRKGNNVTTSLINQFRKEKAKFESANKIGFSSTSIKRKSNTTLRGIQGYYLNCSTNEYVWLRSSWEYIFAKFLNKIKAKWKVEVTEYKLSDGACYKPDFFLYDKNWCLVSIVEIKGYWDDKAYKLDLLENDKNSSDIKLIMIRDIKKYIDSGSTLRKEIESWKQLRKSKEFISKELK